MLFWEQKQSKGHFSLMKLLKFKNGLYSPLQSTLNPTAMNKEQLIKEVADRAGLTKKAAREVVNATLDAIASTLKKGESVQLVGFGSFVVAQRKQRKGRNPRTGEPIMIPARKVVKFRPGKELRF